MRFDLATKFADRLQEIGRIARHVFKIVEEMLHVAVLADQFFGRRPLAGVAQRGIDHILLLDRMLGQRVLQLREQHGSPRHGACLRRFDRVENLQHGLVLGG